MPEFLVARAPENDGEKVKHPLGGFYKWAARVSLPIEVTAGTPESLISALRAAIADREIDPDECVGLHGFGPEFPAGFSSWRFDGKLASGAGPWVAVIWHPAAIVPPCTVLERDAVIYGAVVKQ